MYNKYIKRDSLYRWCANQVIGSPKVYPAYGDKPGAWAMKNKDENQFLEVNRN